MLTTAYFDSSKRQKKTMKTLIPEYFDSFITKRAFSLENDMENTVIGEYFSTENTAEGADFPRIARTRYVPPQRSPRISGGPLYAARSGVSVVFASGTDASLSI